MAHTFFFYDLETSGLSGRDARIMQFAGIRTDESFQQIGDSYNVLVKLNDDVLPSPEALMVTGITPQQTQADGYSEAEFARFLEDEIFLPDTIVVGFNNVRFDDEFIRHLFWRTFHDPYEWAYKDGRSRWDLLDVVRMTRALRPDGIEWPFDDKGEPANRLELLTKLNGIDHLKAHDALSDVEALIAVTKLIHDKQPQLFEYLLRMRDKKEVQKLVNLDNKQPFVYVSGRYDKEFHKATVAFPIAPGRNNKVAVYDLRYDPTPFVSMSLAELKKVANLTKDQREKAGIDYRLPVKELHYGKVPAVAPLGVLEAQDGWARIGLDQATIERHQKILLQHPAFAENIRTLYEEKPEYESLPDAEAQLYDSFVPDADRIRVAAVRNADANSLADLQPNFIDERLDDLLLRYKARNYPSSLSEDESAQWESWCATRIQAQLPGFLQSLEKLSGQELTSDQEFVLQELQLWVESIAPIE